MLHIIRTPRYMEKQSQLWVVLIAESLVPFKRIIPTRMATEIFSSIYEQFEL